MASRSSDLCQRCQLNQKLRTQPAAGSQGEGGPSRRVLASTIDGQREPEVEQDQSKSRKTALLLACICTLTIAELGNSWSASPRYEIIYPSFLAITPCFEQQSPRSFLADSLTRLPTKWIINMSQPASPQLLGIRGGCGVARNRMCSHISCSSEARSCWISFTTYPFTLSPFQWPDRQAHIVVSVATTQLPVFIFVSGQHSYYA